MDMKVLAIPGNHNLDNLGDNVMLMVMAQWLKEMIEDLTISVVTRNPARLGEIMPEAVPLVIGSQPRLPGGLVNLVRRFPLVRGEIRRRRYHNWTSQVVPALTGAKALVLSGQGVLTDAFSHEAIWRLELLDKAHELGKRTALFSQGLGVVRNSRLASAMRQVLPKMDLIVVRNARDAGVLRTSYGCKGDQLRIGGDDGLAYPDRVANPARSEAVGVSIRLADYAGIQQPFDPRWEGLKYKIAHAAEMLGASLLPVPVEVGDLKVVEKSFGLNPEPDYSGEIDELIRSISECRLVVTGSYHSAVFALAMGIPAICLVFSDYYAAKFEGLAEQYPVGCLTFDPRTMELDAFETFVKSTWMLAKSMSGGIASTSRSLVALNHAHYRYFSKLLHR
jgi:polysaccharide pyruvyl transferase WcaK-like protein